MNKYIIPTKKQTATFRQRAICRMEKNKVFAMLFFLVIIMASNASAIGVTPGRTTLAFTPGLEESVSFSIINSETKDINIVVAVQGELAEYITLSQTNIKISAVDGSKQVNYIVKLPQSLSPGLHTAEIVVLQLPEEGKVSEAYVGAAVAVVTQLHVNVPYPGKYAEASFSVVGPDNDGKVTFIIPVESRGEFDLTRVRATIDIFSSLNEKVTTVGTNELAIGSRQRKELVASWDAKVSPGPYRAVATVIADEQTISLEKDFTVGERKLKIEKIEVNDFRLGDIAKFEILVENTWSQAIQGVAAQMIVYGKDGNVLADFRSPTHDIPPLGKTLVVAFWDTAGVRVGTYDSTLLMNYGGNSEQQKLKLEVEEDRINVIGIGYVISSGGGRSSIFDSGLTITLTIGIIILVLLNLSWFLFLRRRLGRK